MESSRKFLAVKSSRFVSISSLDLCVEDWWPLLLVNLTGGEYYNTREYYNSFSQEVIVEIAASPGDLCSVLANAKCDINGQARDLSKLSEDASLATILVSILAGARIDQFSELTRAEAARAKAGQFYRSTSWAGSALGGLPLRRQVTLLLIRTTLN